MDEIIESIESKKLIAIVKFDSKIPKNVIGDILQKIRKLYSLEEIELLSDCNVFENGKKVGYHYKKDTNKFEDSYNDIYLNNYVFTPGVTLGML